jgi:hypothetical protein
MNDFNHYFLLVTEYIESIVEILKKTYPDLYPVNVYIIFYRTET